jgi:hypothetical protein
MEVRVTHVLSRNAKRVLATVVLTGALLSVGGLPASAATLVSHSGTPGPTTLKDTATAPGAECTYEGAAGTQYFSGMTLRAIKVEYPDLTINPDHGKAGYRIVLQHASTGGTFSTFVTSPEWKMDVQDSQFAKFPKRSQGWNTAKAGKWRAEAVLTWYNPGGTVIGKSTWLIDNYTRDFNGSVAGTCPGKHFDFPH